MLRTYKFSIIINVDNRGDGSPLFFKGIIIKYLSILFLVLFNIHIMASKDSITMACNDFAPLKIKNAPADRPGSDIEILRESFKFSGINLLTKFYPWKRALEMAHENEIDGVCSCSYSKERAEKFLYSDEMGQISIGLYTRKSEGVNNLEDILKNKKSIVGVVRGYTLEEELKSKGIAVTLGINELGLLRMLELGRINAVYSYKVVVSELALTHRFIKDFDYHEISSTPYFTCFSKRKARSAQLVEKFNFGLGELKKTKKFQEIIKKYGF